VEGKKGAENVTFQSTHILIATGIQPNTGNIGLEKNGVELELGGQVKVNELLQTTLPHIFAVGDCINTPPPKMVRLSGNSSKSNMLVWFK